MRELDEGKLAAILEGSAERRGLEFKSPFSWDDPKRKWQREKVIRAILGMTNTLGGGTIVLGITEGEKKAPLLAGMEPEQLGSFEDAEKVKANVDRFASLGTEFEISKGRFQERTFLLILVSEFDRRPVTCTEDGEAGVLKRGDLYCRSRRGHPRTDRITDSELEELLEIWARKRSALSAPAPVQASALEDLYLSRLSDLK